MSAWWSTASGPLPGANVQFWALHGGWALVLASATWALLVRRSSRVSGVLASLLGLWCLWPGQASPAFWLGLAFQAPSLCTSVWCAAYLLQSLRSTPNASGVADEPGLRWWPLLILGIALGWLLLLDSLALLPVFLYPLGWSPWAVGILALVASLPWVRHGLRLRANLRAWVLPVALLLFVLSRAPSGNVWDAVLDPWLWLVLQAIALRRCWKKIRAA